MTNAEQQKGGMRFLLAWRSLARILITRDYTRVNVAQHTFLIGEVKTAGIAP
jgi:hypothetical protein